MKYHHHVDAVHSKRLALQKRYSDGQFGKFARISRGKDIKAESKSPSSSQFSKGMKFNRSNKERCALRRRNSVSQAELAIFFASGSACDIKAESKSPSTSQFSKGMKFNRSNKERRALRRRNTITEAELSKLFARELACDTEAQPKSPSSSQFSRNFHRRQSMTRTVAAATCPTSLDQQPKSANGIPIVVEACLRYLSANASDCVGLFRVPGESDHVSQLWDYINNHPFARLSINCVDVFMRNHPEFTAHDVASFLKRTIKSMVGNEHVVTYNCYEPLVSLIRSKCPSHQVGDKCRRIIGQLLVPARRLLLGRLCNFLREFSKYHEKTQMDCGSLAVCFANLMQPSHAPQPRTKKRNSIRNHLSSRIGLMKKKVKQPMTADQLRALIMDEGRKSKLCVSVIKVLIEQSEHIFSTRTTPDRVTKKVKKSGKPIFM